MENDHDQKRALIPSGVWVVGFAGLFMDASSELVHSLRPALFVSLGIGMAAIGFIEGVAQATAAITKIFSGDSASERHCQS